MNKLSKSLSIVAATVMLAAPFTSQAANDDAAMDACINAFLSQNLPKEQPVKEVRKEEVAASPISIHARAYKIVVSATGVESGKRIARGTCTVSRSGEVIALDGKALPTKLASR